MRYEETHPWLTFQYRATPNVLWARLGEALSKNQHLAGIPLPPRLAEELASVVLVKGALATTAIEGNTLSEEQAAAVINRGKSLPPSQDYLENEIRNVVAALNQVLSSAGGGAFTLTPDWLRQQNRMVLEGLEVEDHVAPGEYTRDSLVVGQVYRGAPPEDVEYLVERMCEWLNDSFAAPSQDLSQPEDMRFYNAVFGALLAHLYLVWIHPFGDGNGRVARLAEVAILLNSGVVPWVAANLLSDHYNRTRSRYYTRLAAASQKREVDEFIVYAVSGLVDRLREQIDAVRSYQVRIAWTSYVYEQMRDEPTGPTKERRRELVLTLPIHRPIAKRDIRRLSPGLAEKYAGHEDRMIQRDLNALKERGLVAESQKGYIALASIMNAFTPLPPPPDPGGQDKA
jgi:Fic family protein